MALSFSPLLSIKKTGTGLASLAGPYFLYISQFYVQYATKIYTVPAMYAVIYPPVICTIGKARYKIPHRSAGDRYGANTG
jgi:hypothetical protein